jgi:DNA-binding response OmpR family regulator
LKFEEDHTKPNSLEKVLKSSLLNDLTKEANTNVSLFQKLTTSTARKFIEKNTQCFEVKFHGDIKFRSAIKAQDFLLFKIFRDNLNSPISRDQVAQTLWGKAWQTKYSDWAIDKAVSRFRKNLISDDYQLLTVKNIGYQLIKI